MSNDLTPSEFRSAILAVLEKQDKYPPLENHLISLWMVIEKYRDTSPSYLLFAKMIDEALNTHPCSFDKKWLTYKDISWEYESGVYVIKEYLDGEYVVTENNVNDFEILKQTILFQITDLHQIPDENLKDPHSFFGINSPSGARWYNFDPYSYWECATAGMEARMDIQTEQMEHPLDTCDWTHLASLLSLGQLYE